MNNVFEMHVELDIVMSHEAIGQYGWKNIYW